LAIVLKYLYIFPAQQEREVLLQKMMYLKRCSSITEKLFQTALTLFEVILI